MKGNKQILLNDGGDEQSAYLLALEDFCLLPVRDYNYIYGYWVVSGPHGTAFINCTCMFEGSYIYLPSTHIYQRHS